MSTTSTKSFLAGDALLAHESVYCVDIQQTPYLFEIADRQLANTGPTDARVMFSIFARRSEPWTEMTA
jgi:hypothetical protein